MRYHLVVRLDLDVGAELLEVSVHVLLVGGIRVISSRGLGLWRVRLSSLERLELRRELRRRDHLGDLGRGWRGELANLALVGIGRLRQCMP